MRILLLSSLYPPYVEGGAEILAGHIATELERLGHEVLVLTSWHGLPKAQKDGQIWRTLHLAPPAHFDRRRPLWQQFNVPYNYYRRYHYPANMQELRRVVALTHPDVLYTWEITGIGVNSLLKILPDLKVPVVFHLGGYLLLYARSPETEQSHPGARWLKKWLIGALPSLTWASFIAVSKTVKREYVRAGFADESIEVIYNGIDPRFLSSPPTEGAKDRTKRSIELLYIGRLRAEKGLLVLLKALDLLVNGQNQSSVDRSSLHLNIFGTGVKAYIKELQDFLHQKHLVELVTFHGNISQDELIRYYDRSDIMLVPSLWQEPFGLVVVEAMARGLPVIASDLGGPAEILTHDVNGLLIEPGDEQALTLAIRQLLENPDRRARLSQAAQATVRELFTIEENTRRVERHLERAIHSHQRSSEVLNSTGVL